MSARDGDTPDGHGPSAGAGAPGDAPAPLEPRLSTDPAPEPAGPEPVPAPEWIRTDPASDGRAPDVEDSGGEGADAAPAGSGSAAAPAVGGKDPRRRRASKAVVIGGTLAVAAAMVGGGVIASREDARTSETEQAAAAGEWTESDFAQVCRDDRTQERLEDEECAGAPEEQTSEESSYVSSSGHHVSWFYIPLSGGRTVPAVGYQVGSGQSSRPASGSTTKVSSSGGQFANSGTVSKGGFGTKGGGAGS